jgi:hypothetical protein
MKYKPFLIAVSALVLSAAIARAQAAPSWTQNNAYQAWEGFKGYFYTSGAKGGDIIAEQRIGNQSPNHWSAMWQEAEEIEVAEDAFYWSQRIGGNTSNYLTHVNNLCNGFIDNMTPAGYIGPGGKLDWSGDVFNDDLMWASIAFARAYQITHDPDWLTAAKNQFNTVWTRAQAGNGGLIQSQKHTPRDGSTWVPNLDAPVNFTFVIAGYLIYDNTGDASYKNKADTVYAWASANLFGAAVAGPACQNQTGLTCVKIYDSNNTGPFPNYKSYTGGTIGRSDYAYNYGTAIQAAVREALAGNDAATNEAAAQNIANYLMFNMNNPNFPYGPPYNGYNILPNYGQDGTNNAGYNGIALRGVGLGLNRKNAGGQPILNATTLAWAQTNLQAAWNIRNSDNVMWNDWVDSIPGNYTYHSWDCSSAVAGMLDIAPPN